MRSRTLVDVDPFEHINFLGNLVRVKRIECGLVRLEFGKVVPIHDSIFFYALKDNHPAASVTHR